MTRDIYVGLLRDLLSGDPTRIRTANLALYREAVINSSSANMSTTSGGDPTAQNHKREADLVLAEIAG